MVNRVHLPSPAYENRLPFSHFLLLLLRDRPLCLRGHVLFPMVDPCELVRSLIYLGPMRYSIWLPQIEIILIVTFMVQRIIEVLVADPVVYLVHLDILLEEVLVPATLQDLEAPGLRPLYVISHQPPLHAPLQDEFGRLFQRRLRVYHFLR